MTETLDTAVEALVRRDRRVVVGALTVVIAASWGYLLSGGGMSMSAFEMTRMSEPGPPSAMAMMLPSAAPMILIFAKINRTQRERDNPFIATSVFASGYLAAWAAFSLVATLLQWAFETADLLSPVLVRSNEVFGGVLLLAAGAYQLTPIKYACLRHCRSPLEFLSGRWQPGADGAHRMGIEHGTYCVGCCWFLM